MLWIDAGLNPATTGGHDVHNRSVELNGINLPHTFQSLLDIINNSDIGENDPNKINLDETMVVINTEFGRTPYRQGTVGTGTNHHPEGYVSIFIGGPISGRSIYGAMDDQQGIGQTFVRPSEHRIMMLQALGIYPFSSQSYAVSDVQAVATEVRSGLKSSRRLSGGAVMNRLHASLRTCWAGAFAWWVCGRLWRRRCRRAAAVSRRRRKLRVRRRRRHADRRRATPPQRTPIRADGHDRSARLPRPTVPTAGTRTTTTTPTARTRAGSTASGTGVEMTPPADNGDGNPGTDDGEPGWAYRRPRAVRRGQRSVRQTTDPVHARAPSSRAFERCGSLCR